MVPRRTFGIDPSRSDNSSRRERGEGGKDWGKGTRQSGEKNIYILENEREKMDLLTWLQEVKTNSAAT